MHIVHAIEHKEWPVSVNFTAGDEIEIIEKDQSEIITITTDHGIPRSIPVSLSNNVGGLNITNITSALGNAVTTANIGNNISISSISNNNTSSAMKKRKRHIAIDVETERGI